MACVTFLNKHTFQQFAFNLDSIIFSQLIYMLGFFILSDKIEKCNDIIATCDLFSLHVFICHGCETQ